MSNYPDGFDIRLLDGAPDLDNSELDQLCDEAEAKLANYTPAEAAASEDDLLFEIGMEMDSKISKLVDDDNGAYEDASHDYRAGLEQSHPKLHAVLEAL